MARDEEGPKPMASVTHTGTNVPYARPCPTCGTCPTCGRGPYHPYPHYPWTPFYPQPWWTQPWTITSSSGGVTYTT